MASLDSYVLQAEKAEREIENLVVQLKNIKNEIPSNIVADDEANVPEELEKLRIENVKLKYRLGILQRATENETKKSGKNV
jgi:hypothetical protein